MCATDGIASVKCILACKGCFNPACNCAPLVLRCVQTFANTTLLDDGLAEMRFDNPSLLQRQSLGSSQSRQRLAQNEDPGHSDGSQLLGKGQRIPVRDAAGRAALQAAVQQFVTSNPTLSAGWSKKRVAAASGQVRAAAGTGVYTFKRALKGGDEQLSTDSYLQGAAAELLCAGHI